MSCVSCYPPSSLTPLVGGLCRRSKSNLAIKCALVKGLAPRTILRMIFGEILALKVDRASVPLKACCIATDTLVVRAIFMYCASLFEFF
jgi:hypothetical protein